MIIDDNVPVLEWLSSNEVPYDISKLCRVAAKHNSYSVLKWALHRGAALTPNLLNIAIRNEHLELVRWMHEEKHVPFERMSMAWATNTGNLELLKYVVKKNADIHVEALKFAAIAGSETMVRWLRDELKRPWVFRVCAGAARGGHLSLLQYLRSQDCPWDRSTTYCAAEHGHLSVLQWAVDNGCPLVLTDNLLAAIIKKGHLDVLRFLCERDPTYRYKSTELSITYAARNGHFAIVRFLCPLQTSQFRTTLLKIIVRSRKPSALKTIQWLIEQTHCEPPSKNELDLNRKTMRLDVVKYLEKKELMTKSKKRKIRN